MRKNAGNLFFLQADTVYLIMCYLLKLNILILKGLPRLYALVVLGKKATRFNATRCLLHWRTSKNKHYEIALNLLIQKTQLSMLIKLVAITLLKQK